MNNPELIEREIRNVKRNLDRQLSAAEEKVREVTDWKTHYRKNPLPMLAAAAAAGFVLSAVLGGGDDSEGRPPRALGLASSSMNGTAEKMMDALIAAASVKAAEYIEQFIPGFHQEFSRRQ